MLSRWFKRSRRLDLFYFHDGVRNRSVDPIEVWAALDHALSSDWTEQLALIASPPVPGLMGELAKLWERDRQQAAIHLAEAVSIAFEVPAYRAGRGLTVADRIRLASRFLEFTGGLANRAGVMRG